MKKQTLLWLALLLTLTGLLAVVSLAQAQGGMITGFVSSPDGYPLPAGTRVKLFDPNDWQVFGQAIADVDDGSFSLGTAPNGRYAIKSVPPSGSEYTQSEIHMVSILNNSVDVGELALTRPQISGTVVAPDGFTLADAWVHVYAADGQLLQGVETEAGHFAIGGLKPGKHSLVAWPTGQEPHWKSEPQEVQIAGTTTLPVSLVLTPADIYGVAQDELGVPVPLAFVYALDLTSSHWIQADLTDASGYFAIGGLAPGDYLLGARSPWPFGGLVAPQPISITLPTADNPYTLIFDSGSKIVRGTVKTNTQTPVENAKVIAHRVNKSGRVSALSGSDGSYQLDLTSGLWALTVKPISATHPADWVYNQSPQLVHFRHTIGDEGKVQNFVVLTADANVTGAVLLPDGSPPNFTVTVSLHNDEGIGMRDVISAADGSFDISLPNGGYKIWVKPHDPRYMGPILEPIHVPPSSTLSLGSFYLLAKNSAITGTVTDESGVGLAGIPLSAWRPGIPGGAETRSGPDGQYLLPVVAGDWHVQPSPGPEQPFLYLGAGIRVSVGISETVPNMDFELVTADATINGILLTKDGNPASEASGWASAADPTSPSLHNGAPIEAGTFTIHVPGGHSYVVAAHLPAGGLYMSAGEKHITVDTSGTVTVTLMVQEKDATIDGLLWDPRNEDVVEGVDGLVGAWADGNWAGAHVNSENGVYRFDVAAGLWHLGYRLDPNSGYVKLVHHKNVPVASGQTAHVPLPVAPTDGLISGTVLGPNGLPMVGATVVADGIGPYIEHVWLTTRSGPDGHFRLAVPQGAYHLGATAGVTSSIKPATRRVDVPPLPAVSGGHELQFQAPDATISGRLTISGTNNISDTVLVWAWSDNDGFVQGRFPVTGSTGMYSLNVISNTTWHLGAVYETPSIYWAGQSEVEMVSGDAIQDIDLNGPHPKPGPVAVTFDASQPQRILLADGTHIFIPAGAMPVEGRVRLHIIPIATLPHQRHANLLKYGYAFNAVDSSGEPITEHFNQDVIIGFSYDRDELRRLGFLEHFIKPAYFSTTTNQWTFPESYVVDYDRNTVVMQIDHFTDFCLTGMSGTEVFLPVVIRQ